MTSGHSSSQEVKRPLQPVRSWVSDFVFRWNAAVIITNALHPKSQCV